jgi:AcrR family transcriptional regulator
MKVSEKTSASGKYHHGDLRRALLEAAAETIEDHGLENLSLRELARKLGVTTAAPYHHFKDRHALMVALAQEGYTELLAELQRAQAASTSADGELEAEVRAYLHFARRQRALYLVMLSSELVPDHREGVLKQVSEASLELARATIARCGGLGMKQSVEAAFCIFSLLDGILRLDRGGVLRESSSEQDRLALQAVRGIVREFAV